MNQEELNEILEKHILWITSNGEEGKNTNLYNAYLKGANLEDADLRGADLTKADLREADLRKANLMEATLIRKSFKETKVCKDNYDYLISLGVDKENLVLVEEY